MSQDLKERKSLEDKMKDEEHHRGKTSRKRKVNLETQGKCIMSDIER